MGGVKAGPFVHEAARNGIDSTASGGCPDALRGVVKFLVMEVSGATPRRPLLMYHR